MGWLASQGLRQRERTKTKKQPNETKEKEWNDFCLSGIEGMKGNGALRGAASQAIKQLNKVRLIGWWRQRRERAEWSGREAKPASRMAIADWNLWMKSMNYVKLMEWSKLKGASLPSLSFFNSLLSLINNQLFLLFFSAEEKEKKRVELILICLLVGYGRDAPLPRMNFTSAAHLFTALVSSFLPLVVF